MERTSLIILLLTICCSCSTTHYYAKIKSTNNNVLVTEHGDFVTENDSLYIVHSFNGENAPVNLLVYNKSNTPFFIDWSQSSFVKDGQAEPYRSEYFELGASMGSYSTPDYNFSSGSFYAGLSLPSTISFVPPSSQIEHIHYSLETFPFDEIPNKYFNTNEILLEKDKKVDILKYDYTLNSSPLKFNSYITILQNYSEGENNKREGFNQSFYMSSLVKSKNDLSIKTAPGDYSNSRGDLIHIKKQKTLNPIVWAIIGGAAFIITSIIIFDSMSGDISKPTHTW